MKDDAVQVCEKAQSRAEAASLAAGDTAVWARHIGRVAYKGAMPSLQSKAEVLSYIGCVARGIALGLFSNEDASHLLYAAQIAISVLGKGEKGT